MKQCPTCGQGVKLTRGERARKAAAARWGIVAASVPAPPRNAVRQPGSTAAKLAVARQALAGVTGDVGSRLLVEKGPANVAPQPAPTARGVNKGCGRCTARCWARCQCPCHAAGV